MKRDSEVVPEPFVGSAAWWAERANMLAPVVACTDAEDMCRQEYGLTADIKYQIQQFGVGHPSKGGVVDFDNMDLTRALELIEESSQQWLRLPRALRDRYQSWAAVEAAAASGELEQVLKAAGAGEVPSPVPAASASDSAPVPKADV